MSDEVQPVYILMGVSGAGKTTIGKLLGQRLGLPFFDADDFHPRQNIEKMRGGIPLTDIDRQPWLEVLSNHIQDWQARGGAVLACSALKERYRRFLACEANVRWVYLAGNETDILMRMQARQGHYMPAALLRSQFEALEVPDYGLHIDCAQPPEIIVARISGEFNLNPNDK